MVFNFQRDAGLARAVNKGLRQTGSVEKGSTGIEDISPKLALISFSRFSPLDNRRDGDNSRNGGNMMFENVANRDEDAPNPSHKSPVSALIFIFGTIGVLLWGRR